MKILLNFICCFLPILSFAQNGIVQGRVYDAINNEGIPFANVVIQGTTIGASTDIDGNYVIEDLQPALYNVEVSYLGYRTKVEFEVQVSNTKPAVIDFALEENTEQLKEVVVKAQPFSKSLESPVSLKSIGVSEIKRNPGGNRDISKAIQSLPGVGSTVSFRNDILIRGGSPGENKFYVDGIEIPTINHFQTQGASGGPVGVLNVDFIKEVDFYSGAFPASRPNTLSSVFDFKFIEGRKDRLGASFTVGSNDLAAVLEGPLSKKNKDANFIFSARYSYLQFLFKALQLPFLPTYSDFQYKFTIPVKENHRLILLGTAAIDDFVLNLEANETEEQRYLLGNLPVNGQWNYTFGAKYTYFADKSYTNFIVSTSKLKNTAYKYFENDESIAENLLFDYNSTETEYKFRLENVSRIKDFKITAGLAYEHGIYTNETFRRISFSGEIPNVNYEATLPVNKYGLFAQVSRNLLEERLSLSLGLNAYGSDYNKNMANPLNQFSPRFSASYTLTDNFSLNFNTGLYYQLPAYTIMGYKVDNDFVNQDRLKYIRSTHVVGGVEWNTSKNSRITVEGYYKLYDNYPFSLRNSISFGNLGGDFGVVGDDEFISNSQGRTYGMEFLFQQKLFKGYYGLIAYTLGWSQFEDKNGSFVSSAWDARHIVSLTGGKQFKKNWEIGVKWRMTTGTPYTPYNEPASALIENWNAGGEGVLDYDRLNTERIPAYHQLDIRVDKKWFFKKWSLNLFLDIQNFYAKKVIDAPILIPETDETTGELQVNPDMPNSYLYKYLNNESAVVQPTIGIIVAY